MGDRHELGLDPARQVNRICRMVIRFETVNPAPARIVKMNADKNGILLGVLNRHALFEWNKYVGRTCHHDFQLRFTQLARETFGDIEIRDFLRAAKFAVSTVVFAAVARIDNDSAERFAGVFCTGLRRPPSGGASTQEP